MNRRLLTILLSAFAIAALCSFVVFRIVSHHMSASPMSKSTSVVAAAADLKIGTILKSSDLTTVQLQGTLPQGVILKPEDAVGRGVISELYAGEPIMDNRLAAPGSGGGLAATIPNGMRAAAVRVDEVVGLAGFVTPGMRVDVLISGNPPGSSKNVQEPSPRPSSRTSRFCPPVQTSRRTRKESPIRCRSSTFWSILNRRRS